jgi:hypothetical protein
MQLVVFEPRLFGGNDPIVVAKNGRALPRLFFSPHKNRLSVVIRRLDVFTFWTFDNDCLDVFDLKLSYCLQNICTVNFPLTAMLRL